MPFPKKSNKLQNLFKLSNLKRVQSKIKNTFDHTLNTYKRQEQKTKKYGVLPQVIAEAVTLAARQLHPFLYMIITR
jgi:hypothetical protein